MMPGVSFAIRGGTAVALVIVGEKATPLLTIAPDGTVECDDVLLAGDAGELFVESVRHCVTARTKGLVADLATALSSARKVLADLRECYLEGVSVLTEGEDGAFVPQLDSLNEAERLTLSDMDCQLEQIDAVLARAEASR